MTRIDGREFDQIRDLKITRNYTKYKLFNMIKHNRSKNKV